MYSKMDGAPQPSERWAGLQSVLCSASPLAHPDFEPSEEVSTILLSYIVEQYFIVHYLYPDKLVGSIVTYHLACLYCWFGLSPFCNHSWEEWMCLVCRNECGPSCVDSKICITAL